MTFDLQSTLKIAVWTSDEVEGQISQYTKTSYPLSYQCFTHIWWFRCILEDLIKGHARPLTLDWPCKWQFDLQMRLKVKAKCINENFRHTFLLVCLTYLCLSCMLREIEVIRGIRGTWYLCEPFWFYHLKSTHFSLLAEKFIETHNETAPNSCIYYWL